MEDKLRAYYLPLLERYGATARGVGWSAKNKQRLRYEMLLDVAANRKGGRTWLEVGCGAGGLLRAVGSRRLGRAGVAVDTYTGIDALPEMVAAAKKSFPAALFEVSAVSEYEYGADYVIASGIFALADWAEMRQIIGDMWDSCRIAVAFNFLTPVNAPQQTVERTHDRFTVLAYCRTLTPWVALRADYLPHDATIYMYREART